MRSPWADGEANPSRTAVVERGDLRITVTASGRIEPEARGGAGKCQDESLRYVGL